MSGVAVSRKSEESTWQRIATFMLETCTSFGFADLTFVNFSPEWYEEIAAEYRLEGYVPVPRY